MHLFPLVLSLSASDGLGAVSKEAANFCIALWIIEVKVAPTQTRKQKSRWTWQFIIVAETIDAFTIRPSAWAGRTDGPTDERTDRPTNGRTLGVAQRNKGGDEILRKVVSFLPLLTPHFKETSGGRRRSRSSDRRARRRPPPWSKSLPPWGCRAPSDQPQRTPRGACLCLIFDFLLNSPAEESELERAIRTGKSCQPRGRASGARWCHRRRLRKERATEVSSSSPFIES